MAWAPVRGSAWARPPFHHESNSPRISRIHGIYGDRVAVFDIRPAIYAAGPQLRRHLRRTPLQHRPQCSVASCSTPVRPLFSLLARPPMNTPSSRRSAIECASSSAAATCRRGATSTRREGSRPFTSTRSRRRCAGPSCLLVLGQPGNRQRAPRRSHTMERSGTFGNFHVP